MGYLSSGASVCRLGESFPCKLLYELRVERCIDNQYLCDGHNDCYNNERGSDEMFCLNKLQQGCKYHEVCQQWCKYWDPWQQGGKYSRLWQQEIDISISATNGCTYLSVVDGYLYQLQMVVHVCHSEICIFTGFMKAVVCLSLRTHKSAVYKQGYLLCRSYRMWTEVKIDKS